MYKVLIVDDEITVCKGLSVLIDWEQYGYEVTDYALRGVEALQKAASVNYDVVITDIRMPGMDGIELIKRLKEMKNTARVIILSAYRDFEYAKAAVEYGVKDYLLKPIDEKSLIDLLVKIKVEIEEEYKNQLMIHERNLLLREKALVDIVKVGIGNSENGKRTDELDICLEYPYFQVCIIEIEEDDADVSGNERTIVKNITCEILAVEQLQGYVMDLDETRIGIIVCSYEELKLKSGLMFEKLFETIKISTGYNITLSIGNEVVDYRSINESYKNAKNAIKMKFTKETNVVLRFDDMEELQHKSPNKTAEAVIKYVQEHCAEDINLVKISKIFFFNPLYLGRTFKNITGLNFNDFINNCRIDMAVKYLVNTDLMIYEICEKVGYKDKYYFYKQFKKIKGITPSDYRIDHKK